MNNIEFKAWDADGQYMFTPDHFMKNGNGYDCYDAQQEGLIYTEHLLQYTGLKDKNGAKVFEGDIISYWNGAMRGDKNGKIHYPKIPPYYFSKTKNKIAVVVYDAPSFIIENGNPLGSQYLTSEDIEVIGNIYQNPELEQETEQ